jgi:hypothetical protein
MLRFCEALMRTLPGLVSAPGVAKLRAKMLRSGVCHWLPRVTLLPPLSEIDWVPVIGPKALISLPALASMRCALDVPSRFRS